MCDSTKFFEGVYLMCIGLGLMIGSTLNLHGLDLLLKQEALRDEIIMARAYKNAV